jgi:hypothetical protein
VPAARLPPHCSSAVTQCKATEKDGREAIAATGRKDETFAYAPPKTFMYLTTPALQAGLEHDCSVKAEDFEADATRHTEGLKALADAKKVIAATPGEAEALATSFKGRISCRCPVDPLPLSRGPASCAELLRRRTPQRLHSSPRA